MFRPFKIFLDTEGGGGNITDTPVDGGIPASNDKDDIVDFLGTDDVTPNDDDEEQETIDLVDDEDKEEKPKKSKEKKEEKKEEDDEEDEDEDLEDILEEIEEPDDDKLELVTPVKRKEILAKYPKLFKDFPYLEKAYYREQQFTEMFPTIDEAKEAQGKSQALDKFEDDLFKGDVGTVLQAVKQQDQESFYRIVDNYLPSLHKADPAAYLHVVGNLTKQTIIAMLEEAKASSDEHVRNNLQLTAQELHKFVFNSSQFTPPKNLSQPLEKSDGKETELERREKEFAERQFTSVRDDLNTRVNNTLQSTLQQNIDPRDSMTEYVKKNAVREASEALATAMQGDKRFGEIMNRLWKNAHSKGYTPDSIDSIRKAYLSRAKTLLPSVIKKARNNALKGMGKKVKTSDTSRSPRRDKKETISQVPSGMSSLEFLEQED